MRIFDNHFHIDQGLKDYDIDIVKKNIIFNFFEQFESRNTEAEVNDTITLIFDYNKKLNEIQNYAEKSQIQGFKIHTRLQKISTDDYPDLFDAFQTVEKYKLPVIIDAFYTGHNFSIQPNLSRIAEMIQLFPENNFVIAHSGGIKALEYFMHLRKLPNVYFDLSFSLAYLQHASVYQDFKTLIRFGDKEKILFGTDFPFISAKNQLTAFIDIARELVLSEQHIDNILFANSDRVFGAMPNARYSL